MTAMTAQDTSRNSTQLSFRHDAAADENYDGVCLRVRDQWIRWPFRFGRLVWTETRQKYA